MPRDKSEDFKTVYIVSSPPSSQYHHMYTKRNKWMVVDNIEDADLVQFTGGSDVHPSLYGHKQHPKTVFNIDRDIYELGIFELCVKLRKPMVGICRGGQFLHVMNGGTLWQHVGNHANGMHYTDINTQCKGVSDDTMRNLFFSTKSDKGTMLVTSTHHQMMQVPAKDGIILLTASASTFKQGKDEQDRVFARTPGGMLDIECVWYPNNMCLCYQPHPEFLDVGHPCQVFYFSAIENLIFKENYSEAAA